MTGPLQSDPANPQSREGVAMNCRNLAHDRQALVMQDGQRKCSMCYTDAEESWIKELEFRGLDIGLEWVPEHGVAWPYGPNLYVEMRDRLVNWARYYELTAENRLGHFCLPWLLGRTTDPQDCTTCWEEDGPAISNPTWADHPTYWMRDGKPAILHSSPYGLNDGELTELAAIGSLPGVHVEIRSKGASWYGCAAHTVNTYAVEVWSAEVWGSE